MPMTEKGKKIKSAMKQKYGKKKGESVYHASRQKGTIKGVEKKGDRESFNESRQAAKKDDLKKYGLKYGGVRYNNSRYKR